MNEHGSSTDCEIARENLAELALGVLDGENRARTLVHVEDCASCESELDELAIASDGLIASMGEMDPPPGFVDRTVELFGEMATPMALGAKRPSPVGRRVLAVAAAIVVLVLGLAVGFAVRSPSGTGTSHGVAAASFTSRVGAVGHVVVSGGRHGWLLVTLEADRVHGSVECSIQTNHGSQVVGDFHLNHGYGSWALRLPVPKQTLHSVTVMNGAGDVLATAVLPT